MNFSLNSDDPLVCHTTKDLEEKIAINKIGLSPAEITRAVSLALFCCLTNILQNWTFLIEL